jgi:predicted TIM-barrel fold metal-dependent hydrolase
MTIMDAGVHVWRPQAPDRPWMPGRKAHLPDPLTYEKFSAMQWIVAAREKPGTLTIGTSSAGTTNYLAALVF